MAFVPRSRVALGRTLVGAAFILTVTLPAVAGGVRTQAKAERPRDNGGERNAAARQRHESSRAARCTLRVHAPGATATAARHVGAFSAREVSDLRFDVWLLLSRSSHPVDVRLYTPNGNLFKVLRVGASEMPAGEIASRVSRRGLSVLSARLPLVGTHITSRALYGTWRAEAYFVDSEEACARPLEFEIEP